MSYLDRAIGRTDFDAIEREELKQRKFQKRHTNEGPEITTTEDVMVLNKENLSKLDILTSKQAQARGKVHHAAVRTKGLTSKIVTQLLDKQEDLSNMGTAEENIDILVEPDSEDDLEE